MNPNDILLWSDGFWCFREEHSKEFMRSDDFRVVEYHSAEWHQLYSRGYVTPHSPGGG